MKSLPFVLVFFLLAPVFAGATQYLTFTSTETVAAGDVAVEIEGQQVQVVDFFAVDAGAPEDAFLYHPAGRRQIVILFDLIFVKPNQLLAARAQALDFLKKVTKDDLITIAGISSQGLKVFCASSADRNQIIAGLNALGKEKLEGMTTGVEGNYYTAKFTGTPPGIEPMADDEFLSTLKPLGLDQKRKDDHNFIMVQGMVDLAYSLSQVHGRKAVILFSPGFDTKGISLNLDLDKKRSGGGSMSADSDPASLDTITNSTRDLEALAQQGPGARPKQTGVDVIPGLYAGGDSQIYAVNLAEGENGFLKELSEKTNGMQFQKTVNADQVLAAEQKFYVLEWQDTSRKEWKTLNSLKISAGAKKITAANKWMSPRPLAEETPLDKRMHLAEAVYKDFKKANENYRFWVDFSFEESISKISSFIQVGSAEFLKNGKEDLPLEFYGYTIGRDGAVMDSGAVPVSLELGNDKLRERISKSGLKVWNVLFAESKPLMVRTIIINSKTGETITNNVFLDLKASELTMSNPFIPATDFTWIVWPKPQEELTRRGTQIRYPYRTGPDFFFPDLAPVMNTGATPGVVYFRLYNILPESQNPPVKFHLLDTKGQSLEIQSFSLMQKPNGIEHSGLELFWNVNSLPASAPGVYRIKIGILDTIRKQVVVREVQNLTLRSS